MHSFQPGFSPPYISPRGPMLGLLGNICDVCHSVDGTTVSPTPDPPPYVPVYCSARSRILYVMVVSLRILSPSKDSSSKTIAPRAINIFWSLIKFSTSSSLGKPATYQTQNVPDSKDTGTPRKLFWVAHLTRRRRHRGGRGLGVNTPFGRGGLGIVVKLGVSPAQTVFGTFRTQLYAI